MKKTNEEEEPRQGWFDSLKARGRHVQDLLHTDFDGPVGKGVEFGVGVLMARTVLRRLPTPFNFIAPFVAEKLILKYGVESGREMLLKSLRWVKRKTDDKPEKPMVL